MFLIPLTIGLTGLAMMALPAFGRHGHGVGGHGGGGHGSGGHAVGGHAVGGHAVGGHAVGGHAVGGHAVGGHAVGGHAPSAGHTAPLVKAADGLTSSGVTRFVPSPRTVFSLLALYGAFGNALVHAAGLGDPLAALVAVVPALAVERFAITPLWNLMLRAQADPSSPLHALLLSEAQALTPFRNGRGMVSVVRDGRSVQFPARLRPEDAAAPVRVGDRLWVEAVDPRVEWLTVSPMRPANDPKPME